MRLIKAFLTLSEHKNIQSSQLIIFFNNFITHKNILKLDDDHENIKKKKKKHLNILT